MKNYLIIFFLFYTKIYTFGNIISNDTKEYYVYQSLNDSTDYYIEILDITNDTICRQAGWIRSLSKLTNKNIALYLSSVNITRIDTLIQINKSKYIFKNGDVYIDTLAPSTKSDNLDPVWLNNTVFIEKSYYKGEYKFIVFKYINFFVTHSQYSYTFEINKWITEYEFPDGHVGRGIYKLIFSNL